MGVDGESRGALHLLGGERRQDFDAKPFCAPLAIINTLRLQRLSHGQIENALMRFFGVDDPDDWRVIEYAKLVAKRERKSSISSTMARLDLLVIRRPPGPEQNSASIALARQHPMRLIHNLYCACLRASRLVSRVQPSPILVLVIDRADSEVPSDIEIAMGTLDGIWRRKGVYLRRLTKNEMVELTQEGLQLAPRLANDLVRVSEGRTTLRRGLGTSVARGGST